MDFDTFVFIGRSGCGKGTQAKLLKEKLENSSAKVLYFESGEHFRDYIKGNSYSSNLSKKIMDIGGLQPSFLAVRSWADYFIDNFKGNECLIMDGSPRILLEAKELDGAFKFYNRRAVVIYLNLTREEAEKRLLSRGREDDKSKDEIERRMNWFEECVVPVIEHYKNHQYIKLLDIDASPTVEVIHKDILGKI